MCERRASEAPRSEPRRFGPTFVRIRCFANASDLVDGLSDEIVARLSAAVAKRGHASMVVPGGQTPRLLFDGLCGRAAPWKDVTIVLSDEHWAPSEARGRNEHLVRTRLLTGRAKAARFLPLRETAPTASASAEAADRELTELARPFDVTVLGADAEGQVAALAADALETGDGRLVRAVSSPHFTATRDRLTLTYEALSASRSIALAVMGGQKLAAVQRALQGEPSPVRRLLQQKRGRIEVFWCP